MATDLCFIVWFYFVFFYSWLCAHSSTHCLCSLNLACSLFICSLSASSLSLSLLVSVSLSLHFCPLSPIISLSDSLSVSQNTVTAKDLLHTQTDLTATKIRHTA